MPALIVLGCIILFFVVLFTVHINVRIAMKDDMTLMLRVFGIPIKILPKKPKTYDPKNYTLKKIRKRDAKAAEKAALIGNDVTIFTSLAEESSPEDIDVTPLSPEHFMQPEPEAQDAPENEAQ